MFENLLYQDIRTVLIRDVEENKLPPAILFEGIACSGKLTAALELARVLLCTQNPQGLWNCTCESCKRHKALVSTDVILLGTRSCSLEILAAKKTLLHATQKNARYLNASRYLFLRAVRKLTQRFSTDIWQNDDKLSKFAPILESLEELLEEIDVSHALPEISTLEKKLIKITELAQKLEFEYLYQNIPVLHIRNAVEQAQYTTAAKKRIIIIENAQNMQDSAKNALLKTLEEPHKDILFILLTTSKSRLLPTIQSRVRPYSFYTRSVEQQTEVIERIFHPEYIEKISISDYLYTFLPVSPQIIHEKTKIIIQNILEKKSPQFDVILKEFKTVSPLIKKLFFMALMDNLRKLFYPEYTQKIIPAKIEALIAMNEIIKQGYTDTILYNQSMRASLENITYRLGNELT